MFVLFVDVCFAAILEFFGPLNDWLVQYNQEHGLFAFACVALLVGVWLCHFVTFAQVISVVGHLLPQEQTGQLWCVLLLCALCSRCLSRLCCALSLSVLYWLLLLGMLCFDLVFDCCVCVRRWHRSRKLAATDQDSVTVFCCLRIHLCRLRRVRGCQKTVRIQQRWTAFEPDHDHVDAYC